MEVVKLEEISSQFVNRPMVFEVESEWKDIQEEREKTAATLKFFIGVCDCGAHNLYCLEYSEAITQDDEKEEELTVECPGCEIRRKLGVKCNMYAGAKLRILESWSKEIDVKGLNNINVGKENIKLKQRLAALSLNSPNMRLNIRNDVDRDSKVLQLNLRLSRYREMTDNRYIQDIANQFREQIICELTTLMLSNEQKNRQDQMYRSAFFGTGSTS